MPEKNHDRHPGTPWPRRRFISAAAAAGLCAALGKSVVAAEPASASGPSPDLPVPVPPAGELPALEPFDIHGSPRPGLPRLSQGAALGRFTADQSRLIHDRLDGDERDRLLLGIE